jgi:N-dimethylarginine dimethylaminohydrolase
MSILDTPHLFRDWTLQSASSVKTIPQRSKILMLHPQHFKVSYAINPHMLDSQGNLQEVDTLKATEQWKKLVKVFENCGLEVEIMDSQEHLPDMVFAANQSFVFWNQKKERAEALLSNMQFDERKKEVPYFEEYFKAHDYEIHKLPKELSFEGSGDALIDTERGIIFCGYGFRTHKSMPSRICEVTNYPCVPLELSNPHYYHLDTCLALLNQKEVVIVDDAFSDESLDMIYAAFENVIHADPLEGKNSLAANLFCPNGKDVVIDQRNKKLIQQLSDKDYTVHAVDTGEFLKAGASVFCLKQFLW